MSVHKPNHRALVPLPILTSKHCVGFARTPAFVSSRLPLATRSMKWCVLQGRQWRDGQHCALKQQACHAHVDTPMTWCAAVDVWPGQLCGKVLRSYKEQIAQLYTEKDDRHIPRDAHELLFQAAGDLCCGTLRVLQPKLAVTWEPTGVASIPGQQLQHRCMHMGVVLRDTYVSVFGSIKRYRQSLPRTFHTVVALGGSKSLL